MSRLRVSTLWLSSAALLAALVASPSVARADVTIFDQDGWSFYTNGLVATHYQLTMGDSDPKTLVTQAFAGGKFQTSNVEDGRNGNVVLSRMRSGFVGTQIGFGVNRQISQNVHVESLLAISVDDVSNDRGQGGVKGVDYREAWAAIVGPYGTFKFGRMFSIFGSASAQVVLIAYRYGIGNPCAFSVPGHIACGSVGAGPLYAGFDAQMRYISPRIGGIELQISISDPTRAAADYTLTPVPRVDGEINFDGKVGPAHAHVTVQGLYEQPKWVDRSELKGLNVWGAMASGIVDAFGATLGGGAWTGAGIGIRVPLEVEDPTYPLSYDPETREARHFLGAFGNLAYQLKSTGTGVALGGGAVFIKPTNHDKQTMDIPEMMVNGTVIPAVPKPSYSVLTQNYEGHVVFTQQFDAVVFTLEYMRFHSKWYFGEQQSMNFMAVGANYFW
jgi:hypothetical protein